ncbi:hypothetical protein HPB47_018866 [Ixodes persulcatus]|uniref:Uncharacterized protein n=1 Tax=Ixodes persulcatus TaxID=34615 RepID=A0AC60QJN3_IXOPE|nr:hypothetical protein HPB47_018866 [Ixodes persulcatus]
MFIDGTASDPAVLQPACPPTADVDGQLWSAVKTLWQQLADTVVGEFGGVVTADQAENKWKSLERAYKNAKSKKQQEEHHIAPTVWLAPGRGVQKEGETKDRGRTLLPCLRGGSALKPAKRKRETALGSLLKVFADMEESRKQRHKDRMALLERLVTAIEKSAPAE